MQSPSLKRENDCCHVPMHMHAPYELATIGNTMHSGVVLSNHMVYDDDRGLLLLNAT
jgi:hypothetical protein